MLCCPCSLSFWAWSGPSGSSSRRALLAKGPVQVLVYFVGVVLALWIIGWIVDAFLPQWVAQRLLSARGRRTSR